MKKDVIYLNTSPTIHYTIIVLTILVIFVLVISIFTQIDIVARARGTIVPADGMHSITAPLSGRLARVLVGNGDIVEAGDVIMEMDDTALSAQKAAIQKRLNSAQRDIDHHSIMLEVISKVQDTDIADYPMRPLADLVKQRITNFSQADRALLQASISELEKLMNFYRLSDRQAQADVALSKEVLNKNKLRLENLMREYNIHEKDLTSSRQKLDMDRMLSEVKAQLSISERMLEQKIATGAASRSKKQAEIALRRQLVERSLAEANSTLRLERENLSENSFQISKLRLIAPVTGVIFNNSFPKKGDILQNGEFIARISPIRGELKFEAYLPESEFAFVKVGQSAIVRIDAYPAERYGAVKGELRYISLDAITNSDNSSSEFVLNISLDRPEIFVDGVGHPFKPGMRGTVDIITGSRSIISYLLEPIIHTFQQGWRER